MKEFATRLPLTIDTPGLLFVDARHRLGSAKKSLPVLLAELAQHRSRVKYAVGANGSTHEDDAWSNVLTGVANCESLFGTTIRDFAVADVLLVAVAESFINAIADQVLDSNESMHFEKLNPIGKWIFLPKIMRIEWRHTLSAWPLQHFSEMVSRRNKVVHPRSVSVAGVAEVDEFIARLKLSAKSSTEGVEVVTQLIADISMAWLGSYGPDWLDARKAASRPPCFIIGNVGHSGRLVRGRLKTLNPPAT